MTKEDKKNYFIFLGVYFLSFLTLNIPDIDQAFLGLLGHRSIITHSILLPYLLYHFFIKKKDKPNDYLIFFVIGFYISISIHLSADLHPKGWRGYAFIKLPGDISIGEGPSVIWMFLNIIGGTYFASKLLINISNTKKYLIPYAIIAILIAGFYTAADDGDEGAKFITFLIVFLITFFVAKKQEGGKGAELTKSLTKKKEKKIKKKSGNMTAIIVAVGLVLVFGLLILILGNPQTTSERKMKQEKQSNYRAYDVYKDEFNICKNKITQKYNKKNFSEFSWVSFSAPKNQKGYTKNIIMSMKHDGLVLKNKYFGKIDCFIVVKPNQSITFSHLGNKYK